MITIRLGGNCGDPRWRDPFLKLVRENPGSCDEVWIGSAFAFPPLERHMEAVSSLRETVEIFKANGIRVSTQITNTLGHGQCAEIADCSAYNFEGSPAGHMVGSDGVKAGYCYCYNNAFVREYSQKVVEIYSSLLPHTMWIDDDLRPENHESTYVCFCDDCMALFNAKYNANVTREELVRLVNDDLAWREKWVGFIRDGLEGFTRFLCETVRRVSPDSFLAYQYPHVSNYAGADNRFFFKAMLDASGSPPASRAGHSFYTDTDPMEMLNKAFHIGYCNGMLPDYVMDRRPEIENIPHVPLCKTIYGTMTESSLYLAMGCTALTYSIVGGSERPEDYRDKIFKEISRQRPYWDRLGRVSRYTRAGGVAVAVNERMHLYHKEGEADFEWTKHRWTDAVLPARYGMPLGFDGDAARVVLLTKKLAESLPTDVLTRLKSRPVITEAAAIDHMISRGIEFDICLDPIAEKTVTERFTNHPVNAGNEGKTWRHNFITYDMWNLSGGGVESLSNYASTIPDGKTYGIASAIIDVGNGVKWAVIGSGLTDTIISSARRVQIIDAADYICGYRLPSKIINADKLLNLPRVDANGNLASVSVFNYGIGITMDDIGLILRNPINARFVYADATTGGIELTPVKMGDDEYVVTIPALDGWGIGTVFCYE